jgi:ribosomal protein S18 acetylase RimI-like enzyme
MVIRPATPDDVVGLAALAERTFRDAFAADNTTADMDAYCARAFTPDMLLATVVDAATDTIVAHDETGALVAYAQVRPGTPDALAPLPAARELWRFYVDRVHHGRGLAQQLMAAVVLAGRARGARTLWLGVWERNLKAQAFYRKCGFVDIGSHQFVLGADVQIDRVMARDIAAAPDVQQPRL